MQKRTTTPYGDEQPEEVGSRAARETSEPTYFSPRENAGGGLPRDTPFDRQAVVVSPRTASLVSPRSSGGGRIYDGPYELSPCKRTGRGRVMGHNVMKSSIAFGDANIPMSPSSVRSPRSNHLNSSRVRDLLTWT
uniref:Uncharacterized protein n=1 Tax=Trypanosoma congolense (strain IL3000) TaxID=1068625 RepID=F9W5K0_TRYCI|nr:hypothetical protein, unlikely [Trypanosoma congolense IL3000]